MLSRWQKIFLFLFILLLPSQLALHFWPAFSYINGIKVDYLSPTLYVTDILLIVLIVLSAKESKPLLFKEGVGGDFLKKSRYLFLLILLNIIFSSQPIFTVYWYLKIFFLIIFVYQYFQKSDFTIFVLKVLPYSLFWVCLLALSQFLLKHSVGGLMYWLGERPLSLSMSNVAKVSLKDWGMFLRPYSTFSHPNSLAGFLLVCYFLVLKKNNLLLKTLLSLTLFLTFSRTAIFVYILINLLYFFKKKSFYFLPLLFIPFIIPGNPISLSERISQLSPALKIILTHPVTGVGLGNYVAALSSYPFQPIHNLYLLLISDIGIPLSIYISYIIYKKYISCINYLYPFLAILITGFADHYWFTSHQNLFLIFLLITMSYNEPHARPYNNLH